jgi:hypothetical protein
MIFRLILPTLLVGFGGCRSTREDKFDNSSSARGILQPTVSTNVNLIPAVHIERLEDIPPKKPAGKEISLCSFNIQFLGNSSIRQNEYLANFLTNACDLVFVQEMIAAPEPWPSQKATFQGKETEVPVFRSALSPAEKAENIGIGKVESGIIWTSYPNGEKVKLEVKTTPFFEGMIKNGFSFVLSQDKTSRMANHSNGSESEWFVAFFDPHKLAAVYPEYTTFLKDTPEALFGGGDFIRVPHAFGFRTVDGNLDFVAVSVHLHFTFKPAVLKQIRSDYESGAPTEVEKYRHLFATPGKATVAELDRRQRSHELATIRTWINKRIGAAPAHENDFIILGDTNIGTSDALKEFSHEISMRSFNEACIYTNAAYNLVNKASQACYDQIFFDEKYLTEADLSPNGGFKVFDLTKIVPNIRNSAGIIEDPTKFRTEYSDHFPVMIKLKIPAHDDD